MLRDRQEGFYGGIEVGGYTELGWLGVYEGKLWTTAGLLVKEISFLLTVL